MLLVPLAVELLSRETGGVTTAELLTEAYERKMIPNTWGHKELSGLGHVFRNAGGVNSGETRCSTIEAQKGIRQVVWKTPYRVPVLGRA